MKTEAHDLVTDPHEGQYNSGLTKREYYAGLAMQGVCASSNPATNNEIAVWAVKMADTLIAELNKPYT